MAWRWKESLLLTSRARGSSLNKVIWLRSVAANPVPSSNSATPNWRRWGSSAFGERSRPVSTLPESDPGYDFYVVLSGAVEIVVNSEGKERVIARHGAGRFLGELNLLTGQRVFVSARVAEAGEVIAVPRDALRRLIATTRV